MLLFYLSLIETEEDKLKFERIYNNYGKFLKSIAIDVLHDEFLAEDAVHEAFIKLTRHLDGVDENDIIKTKAFLRIIIKSVCSDMIRKDKKNIEIILEDMDYIGCTNDNSIEKLEVDNMVAVISALPDTYRDIIALKVVHDLSDKEIADIIGISNAAVRKRTQRAREILKNKFVEQGVSYVSVQRN